MLDKIQRVVKTKLYNVAVALGFAGFSAGMYLHGGLGMLTQWGGAVAAAISIFALIFKSQGYWTWSIVNAVLWFILFRKQGLPMLAGLQISYMIFSVYGFFMWATKMTDRIGYNWKLVADNIGSVIATGIFVWTIFAYLSLQGYAFTTLWWVEFSGVAISILSNWMDAFKYKTNWIGWSLTNGLFGYLFYMDKLWGPFFMTFLYQAFCVVGFYQWYKEEQKLVEAGEIERVGGAQYA